MTTGDDISSGAKGKIKKKHVRPSCYGSFSSNHEGYIFQTNKMELYKKDQKRKKEITITNWYEASKETQVNKRHSQIISTIFPFCFYPFFFKNIVDPFQSPCRFLAWRQIELSPNSEKKKKNIFSLSRVCVCVFLQRAVYNKHVRFDAFRRRYIYTKRIVWRWPLDLLT